MKQFVIFFAMLWMVASVSSRSFADPETEDSGTYDLDCSKPDGKQVCVAIRMVESLAEPCLGSGCDFGRLMAQMNHTTTLYIQLLPQTASPQAGNLAKSASSTLCGLEFTGPQQVITRLIVSANRFLESMLELQEMAGLDEPESCQFRSP